MHRLIMDVKENEDIDHIKHNKKDNRKSELRIVTESQNMMNRGLQSNNKSGVTGVRWKENLQKWESNITVNKKQIYLGLFTNFDEAVAVRKKAEEKYFGEYSFENSKNYNAKSDYDVKRDEPAC